MLENINRFRRFRLALAVMAMICFCSAFASPVMAMSTAECGTQGGTCNAVLLFCTSGYDYVGTCMKLPVPGACCKKKAVEKVVTPGVQPIMEDLCTKNPELPQCKVGQAQPAAAAKVAAPAGPAATNCAAGKTLDEIAKQCGFEDQLGGVSVPQLVARIISWVLPVTGSLLLVMFLYGGFMWFTAGGEADRVKKATQTMLNASIGMAIIIGAYAIVFNLIEKFGAALGG